MQTKTSYAREKKINFESAPKITFAYPYTYEVVREANRNAARSGDETQNLETLKINETQRENKAEQSRERRT